MLSEGEEDVDQDSDQGSECENGSDTDTPYDVLGVSKKATWSVPKKAMDFYLEAADIELKPDFISKLKEKYETDLEVETHFTPPRLPNSLWSAVQVSKADTYKLKTLFKAQENLYLSMKPLLDCLPNVNKESKVKITEAIQLICSSNLQLNRFRRGTVAPHLKSEVRRQVLSLPIAHDSFFGEDFSKTADTLCKEQSAIDKMIYKKPVTQRISNNTNRSNKSNNNQFFRAQNFKKPQSGRGYGGRNQYRKSIEK